MATFFEVNFRNFIEAKQMSLKPCPTCGHNVSIRAICCQNCGETEIDRKQHQLFHEQGKIVFVEHNLPARIDISYGSTSLRSIIDGSRSGSCSITIREGIGGTDILWMKKVHHWYHRMQFQQGPHMEITLDENNNIKDVRPIKDPDAWYAEVEEYWNRR